MAYLGGMPNRPSQLIPSPRLRLLLPALLLVAVSCYLGTQYPLPVRNNWYLLGKDCSALLWLNDRWNNNERVYALGIESGRVSRLPYHVAQGHGVVNSKGQRIYLEGSGFGKSLRVFDERTGEQLGFQFVEDGEKLVGTEYLVSRSNQTLKVKRFQVSSQPDSHDLDLAELTFPLAEFEDYDPFDETLIYPIPDTNRFVVFIESGTPTLMALELKGEQLELLAKWSTTKDSQVLQFDGQLFTANSNGSEIDVRDLATFQLLDTRALPPGMLAWKRFNRRPIEFRSQNGLFAFQDASSGALRVHRLDDFSLVPELKLPLLDGGSKNQSGDFRRYVLSSEAVYGKAPATVYDTVERRVVLSCWRPRAIYETGIIDHYLVFASGEMGLTVEVIDLVSGQTVKRHQPYAWILWCLPVILSSALVWAIAWIRSTPAGARSALIGMGTLLGLFAVPQLLHGWQFPDYWYPVRPAHEYVYGTLLVTVFMLSLYAAYGPQRLLLRTAPLWLVMAAVLGLANLVSRTPDGCGLDFLDTVPAGAIGLVVALAVVSTAANFVLRWVYRGLSPHSQKNHRPPARVFALQDLFWLTTSLAAFIAAAMPSRAYLLEPLHIAVGSMIALFACVPMLLGLAGLTASTRVYAFFARLAVIGAWYLVVEATIHFWFGHWFGTSWYSLVWMLRYPVFLFVATFACASIWRQAGYALQDVRRRSERVGEA